MRISSRSNKSEKGVALAMAILALLLLSGIAIGMMYMSSTETSVSANFKAEETEFFAARAGVEEIRDRMLPYNPNTINDYLVQSGVATCQATAKCLLPTTMLGTTLTTNSGATTPSRPPVLYILQSGITMADVTSFATNSKCPASYSGSCLVDDELCHEFPSYTTGGMTSKPSNVRCIDVPSGTAWYNSTTVTASPYAPDWKWVRVTLKANDSANPYTVYPSGPTAGLVCWRGDSEVVAPTAASAANTQNNSPCGDPTQMNPYANPVYIVTALAVSPSGARRIVQQEVAQTPQNQPAGLFATGTGCGALSLGGGATTYSFDSSLAADNPPTNPPGGVQNSGGDVGSNGNVYVSGGSTVQGATDSAIASGNPLAVTVGNCNQGNGVSVNGNSGYGTLTALQTTYTPTTPPVPNPMPPTNTCNSGNNYCNGLSGGVLQPGSYGDISVSSSNTLTLQGGNATTPTVYTFNSLKVSGTLIVNGPVIINIAYQGSGAAVDFTSGTINNTTAVAGDLVINYCCSGSVKLTGNGEAYAVVNAPNASVDLTGGSSFYGQILGNTISDTGGVNFYWDKSANVSPVTGPYYEISLRELSY